MSRRYEVRCSCCGLLGRFDVWRSARLRANGRNGHRCGVVTITDTTSGEILLSVKGISYYHGQTVRCADDTRPLASW